VQGYRRSPALWVATLAEQGKQLQDLVLDVSAAVKTKNIVEMEKAMRSLKPLKTKLEKFDVRIRYPWSPDC
jgi:hypothetical protein